MAYICDERSGCVAVYLEPAENCLSGIEMRDDCVFYGHGKYFGTHRGWEVDEVTLNNARRIAKHLNDKNRRIAALEHQLAEAQGQLEKLREEIRFLEMV